MSDASLKRGLWWLCLVIAPAVLIAIELFHPANFTAMPPGMYNYLSQPHGFDPRYVALDYPGPSWWFLLHWIQTPLVGLVGVGLWQLAGKVDDADGNGALALAWLSRAVTFVFIIYYTSLDSVGGTGLGRALLNTHALAAAGKLTPVQVNGVAEVLNANWVDHWVGGVGSVTSLVGSWSILIAAALVAVALFVARKAPWPALVLLVGFGWQLQVSHASPHGPIAFALLIAAALWMWWSGKGKSLRTA